MYCGFFCDYLMLKTDIYVNLRAYILFVPRDVLVPRSKYCAKFCLFDMLSLVGINIRSWFYDTDGLKSFGMKIPRHRSTLVKIADVRNLIESKKSLVFC